MAGKHVKKKTPAHSAPSSGTRTGGLRTVTVTPDWEEAPRARRNTQTKTRKQGRPLVWLLPLLVVLAGGVIAAGIYLAGLNRVASLDTIFPNVSVNGVDVGGLTREEAMEKLLASGADPYRGKSVTVRFPLDKTLTVTAEELGLGSDVTVPVESAFAYGRDGTLAENRRAYKLSQKKPTPLTWETDPVLDEVTLREKVEAAVNELNASLLESSAEIGEEGVTLVKGMNAEKVEADPVIEQVKAAFENRTFDDIVVELVTIAPGEGDISADEELLQSVYDAVRKEPENARYDKETGGMIDAVRGVSFDLEEAREKWNAAQPGDRVFLPFVYTEPEITDITDALFADLLSEKSTSLSGSSSGRVNNITLAAQAMNDTVVNPGETFDYNSCLGQRTPERGYQEAGAYSAGKHVSEVGGGICQGSSTLYYCAMKANLRITVRSSHYFVVGYLPWGMDATVSWGGPDFRFVNSRDYPIKIRAWVEDGELTVQIWGTDVDGSYVDLSSDTWEDDTYYYAQTYRTVYAADGSVISSEREAYSEYHKYEADEERETDSTDDTPDAEPEDEPDPTPEPAPETTPEPTPEPTPPPDSIDDGDWEEEESDWEDEESDWEDEEPAGEDEEPDGDWEEE